MELVVYDFHTHTQLIAVHIHSRSRSKLHGAVVMRWINTIVKMALLLAKQNIDTQFQFEICLLTNMTQSTQTFRNYYHQRQQNKTYLLPFHLPSIGFVENYLEFFHSFLSIVYLKRQQSHINHQKHLETRQLRGEKNQQQSRYMNVG